MHCRYFSFGFYSLQTFLCVMTIQLVIQVISETKETRWVLSETKAVMSPPVCHWMESNFFVEEGELIN